MNAFQHPERQSLQLVDIIDLKWLMARDGVHVHVERLQRDPVYAAELLALAAGSASEAVRAAGQRLGTALARGAPAA
jgi:hypothetical protein